MIDANELLSAFSYDEDTGVFTWACPTHPRIKVGDLAGTLSSTGYLAIKFKKKKFLAHRMAWLFKMGSWPPEGMEIDHINGITTDNRVANLRLATKSQNKWNGRKHSRNTSGFKGVSLRKKHNSWKASIGFKGNIIHLGSFKTAQEAHEAYCAAAQRYHGEFARME